MKVVVKSEDVKLDDLGKGVSRKVLSHNSNLMMVEVHFEEGAVGELHSHYHEQCTYVAEGEFEFTIGNKKEIVKKGDSIYFESNIKHGNICLKKGYLVDVFTPMREDFLKK